MSPATIAAAEEPRPRASGISLELSYRGPRFADDAGTCTRRLRTVIALAGSWLPLDRAADRVGRRARRLVPGEDGVEGLAQPGGVLRRVHVVGVRGTFVAHPQLAVQ